MTTANEAILARALQLTIVCCVEALTRHWDKSDDGFISLIDMAEQALSDTGQALDLHDYADTPEEILAQLYPEPHGVQHQHNQEDRP